MATNNVNKMPTDPAMQMHKLSISNRQDILTLTEVGDKELSKKS